MASAAPGTKLGFSIFFWAVLRIPLVHRRDTLHARLYLYELAFIPSGMSVTWFYVELRWGGSNILDDLKWSHFDFQTRCAQDSSGSSPSYFVCDVIFM